MEGGDDTGGTDGGLLITGRSDGRLLGGFEGGDETGAPDKGLLETGRSEGGTVDGGWLEGRWLEGRWLEGGWLEGGRLDTFGGAAEEGPRGRPDPRASGRALGLLVSGNNVLMTSAMFSVAVNTPSCWLLTS